MNKELKNALDAARAARNELKKQHNTAGAKKEVIIARRVSINKALTAAIDRLEAANLGNFRGVVDAAEVAVASMEHQAARTALERQYEDEDMAARALNMADEFQEATESLDRARTNYFGNIVESIEKPLRSDAKLRGKLTDTFVAYFCMHGRDPAECHPLDRREWMETLVAIFPVPSNEEMQHAFSEFVRTYDAQSANIQAKG